jgi:prepilin-type N-terminal cleavage/methylation domain-containing protein
MNINKKTTRRSGFTLIELLTVIAIIGILAGILIPTIGLVRKNAAKTKAASDLRQIATGYNAFTNSGPRTRTMSTGPWSAGSAQANNMGGWAQILAQLGGFNEAAGYFVDSATDVATLATIPQSVLDLTVDPPVATATWVAAADAGAISYAAAVGLSPNARGTITPLIWTKGVGATASDSTWAAVSPWDGEGGHIGFLDTHVAFYTDLTGQLQTPAGAVVNNIADALPVTVPAVTIAN